MPKYVTDNLEVFSDEENFDEENSDEESIVVMHVNRDTYFQLLRKSSASLGNGWKESTC